MEKEIRDKRKKINTLNEKSLTHANNFKVPSTEEYDTSTLNLESK